MHTPILVTRLGMVMLVKPVQPANASSLMLVTLDGIVTLVSLLRRVNAWLPMLRTLFGIVMSVSPSAIVSRELFAAANQVGKRKEPTVLPHDRSEPALIFKLFYRESELVLVSHNIPQNVPGSNVA